MRRRKIWAGLGSVVLATSPATLAAAAAAGDSAPVRIAQARGHGGEAGEHLKAKGHGGEAGEQGHAAKRGSGGGAGGSGIAAKASGEGGEGESGAGSNLPPSLRL